MILEPGILALLASSFLISLMTLCACGYGVRIIQHWDISSGSELQLCLERRTYLISTIVSYFLAFELISLFLFIRTADSICHLFVGAMCAVGTLTVNTFGYKTLYLKIVNFLLAGVWLVLNHADNKGYDYPLIRPKYLLLLITAPLILIETVFQGIYFFHLRPDIITSCCGSLFSQNPPGMASEILATPILPMAATFYSCIAASLVLGLRFFMRGRGGYLFAATVGATFVVSITAIISFISLYIYEMPSHHCPFCILQKEYGYVGYPLYLLIFVAAVAGLGVGALEEFRRTKSLAEEIPRLQRRLVVVSMISLLLFAGIATTLILFSDLRLEGY
jgi:hypothetical protein